jgi:hypothetical protein
LEGVFAMENEHANDEPRTMQFSILGLLAIVTIVDVLLRFYCQFAREREAARRVKCKDDFRQVMLKMHNYLAAYRRLPSAMAGIVAVVIPDILSGDARSES